MIISITHEDIRQGRINIVIAKKESNSLLLKETTCSISLSARRAGFINPHVAVRLYSDNYEPVMLPREALDFCNDIETSKPIYPFDFNIEPVLKCPQIATV